MFFRRERLSRLDFQDVADDRSAKRITSDHFSVVVSRAAVGCAVVVSKKVSKSSVGRHLLKRRVREVVRSLRTPLLHSDTGIIVYARAGANELDFPTLQAEITTLLQRTAS